MSFSGAHWMYKYAIVIPFLHSLKGRPPRAAVPLHRSCIKVYGKDQIDIIFLLILDKAWGFGMHHLDIDLLIFNDSEGVDQELGVKADHNILTGLMDHKIRIHGTKAGI